VGRDHASSCAFGTGIVKEPKPDNPHRERDDADYRSSRDVHRQSWFGLKRYAKALLSRSVPQAILRRMRRFVPADRLGRLPAPANVRSVTGDVHGVAFVMLRPDRCVVAKELYWGKGHRPQPQDQFAIELFATLAEGSDVVLDIGAYTGLFSLVSTAVNPTLQAHAFEIVPEVHRLLVENCVRNAVIDRVHAYPEGVGAPEFVMRVPVGSGGSALPDFYSSRLRFDDGVLVPFRSLDATLDLVPAGSRVLVKVDVEGTENEVFRHGQRFLAAFRPPILCEVLAGVADPAELGSLLVPHGFRFYLVQEAGLASRPSLEPDPRFRDWLIAVQSADELMELGIPVL
jgi:FkbM family methyltransferase